MRATIKNKVGIVGYGRFGSLLAEILSHDCDVFVYDIELQDQHPYIKFVNLETVAKLRTIFITVPINNFSNTINTIAPLLSEDSTLIDTCSVKLYPVEIMKTYLPPYVGIIATHPIFGPDSINEDDELKIMMHPARDTHHIFEYWKSYFTHRDFRVVIMTPDQHDKFSAKSQALTHFIGRALEALSARSTEIDTLGYDRLLEVMDLTCNDTWDLFSDIQKYNPYSEKITKQFTEHCLQLQRELTSEIS